MHRKAYALDSYALHLAKGDLLLKGDADPSVRTGSVSYQLTSSIRAKWPWTPVAFGQYMTIYRSPQSQPALS